MNLNLCIRPSIYGSLELVVEHLFSTNVLQTLKVETLNFQFLLSWDLHRDMYSMQLTRPWLVCKKLQDNFWHRYCFKYPLIYYFSGSVVMICIALQVYRLTFAISAICSPDLSPRYIDHYGHFQLSF